MSRVYQKRVNLNSFRDSRKKVGKNIDKAKLGNYTNPKACCSHAILFILLASSNKYKTRR